MKTKTTELPNIRIAYALAWRFADKNSRIESADLIGEALLAYTRATQAWSPKKGVPQANYIYTVVKHHLIDFVKGEALHNHHRIEDVINHPNAIDPHPFDLNDIMNPSARTVAEVVLRRADELPDKKVMAHITIMLREEGHKYEEIWQGVAELKKEVRGQNQ